MSTITGHSSQLGRPAKRINAERGWLTPIGEPRGGYLQLRCRCGAVVTRLAKSIARAARDGRVSKCSAKCAGVKEVG